MSSEQLENANKLLKQCLYVLNTLPNKRIDGRGEELPDTYTLTRKLDIYFRPDIESINIEISPMFNDSPNSARLVKRGETPDFWDIEVMQYHTDNSEKLLCEFENMNFQEFLSKSEELIEKYPDAILDDLTE